MNKERLPPGQMLTNDFPVLHVGPIPRLNEPKWSFSKAWGKQVMVVARKDDHFYRFFGQRFL